MTPLDLMLLVALGVAFWLLLIRPTQRRRAEQAALVASLAPGAQIMTTAGVFGTVIGLEGDRMRVEIAPGVVIEMVTAAVGRIVEGASVEPEAPDAPDAPDAVGELDASDAPTPDVPAVPEPAAPDAARGAESDAPHPQQEADRG
jgi:preprotein translocase subunit YajC